MICNSDDAEILDDYSMLKVETSESVLKVFNVILIKQTTCASYREKKEKKRGYLRRRPSPAKDTQIVK